MNYKKLKVLKYLFILLFSLIWANQIFAFSKNDSTYRYENSSLGSIETVIEFGKTFLGKPYRYKTREGHILDCSGFVGYIYKQIGVQLPRTSYSMASEMKKVDLSFVEKGDLLFFKGRDMGSHRVGHVAMVVSVEGDEIQMMHSCNSGIKIEKYNGNRYYTSRFLFAGKPQQIKNYSNFFGNYSDEFEFDDEYFCGDTSMSDNFQSSPIDFTENVDKTVKIIGVGDVMLGTNYPNQSFLPPNDGKNLLDPVKTILEKGDVSFGNLEGVLLTGEGNVKKCSNPNVCYAFKMPDHYVHYLSESHFNLLSLANNHSHDFGNIGTANTMKLLKDQGIHFAGFDECPFSTFEKNGIRYGFAAFAPNNGTVKMNDYAGAKQIIQHLDSVSDVVIVSFHGGAEGSEMNHITKNTEVFLGENRGNPYEFARMAIDAGADVILGHGPHVTRAIDLYKNRFIAYSLGNFATYGRFNLSGLKGIAPILELDLNKDGTFVKGKIHSTKQMGEGGPILDEENQVVKEIQKLTSSDVPNAPLKIDENGNIIKK